MIVVAEFDRHLALSAHASQGGFDPQRLRDPLAMSSAQLPVHFHDGIEDPVAMCFVRVGQAD